MSDGYSKLSYLVYWTRLASGGFVIHLVMVGGRIPKAVFAEAIHMRGAQLLEGLAREPDRGAPAICAAGASEVASADGAGLHLHEVPLTTQDGPSRDAHGAAGCPRAFR